MKLFAIGILAQLAVLGNPTDEENAKEALKSYGDFPTFKDVYHEWGEALIFSIQTNASAIQKLMHPRIKAEETSPGVGRLIIRTGDVQKNKFGDLPVPGTARGAHVMALGVDTVTGEKGFHFLHFVVDSLPFRLVMKWFFSPTGVDIHPADVNFKIDGTQIHWEVKTDNGLDALVQYDTSTFQPVDNSTNAAAYERTHRGVWWFKGSDDKLYASPNRGYWTTHGAYTVAPGAIQEIHGNFLDWLNLPGGTFSADLCNELNSCVYVPLFGMTIDRPHVVE